MANKPIHEQSQALSAYFDDMLTAPATTTEAKAIKHSVLTETPTADSEVETEAVNDTPLSDVVAPPESLRVLLFDIDGVTLAVPVSEINNIVRWPKQDLTAVPEPTDWQLGVFNQQQQTSQVIDIRSLLQTEIQLRPIQANYIVIVDDHRWGIACHHIHHIVTYQSDTINWRNQASQPSWSRGVIIEDNYHIIDIPALLLILEKS